MKCPSCKHDNDHVIDSRPTVSGIRRRRICSCGFRFTSYETLQNPDVINMLDPVKVDAAVRHLKDMIKVAKVTLRTLATLVDNRRNLVRSEVHGEHQSTTS